MNPTSYLIAFAWLAIIALSGSILSDFWLPMLIGAAVVTLLIRLAR
jgi:preprotein translocase subunit SecF